MLWSQKLKIRSKLSELIFSPQMFASWCDIRWRCKQIKKKKTFFVTKISFEGCLCGGNVSITHRGSFVLLSFYGELLVIYCFSSNFSCLYLGTSHFGRPPVFRKFSWCQVFPRSYKHLKGQKLVHLKSVYKILL